MTPPNDATNPARSIQTLNDPEPQSAGVGRRGFLGGAAAASGFALAVQPVSAQTIATSAEGLNVGWIKVSSSDGEASAYRAHPAGRVAVPVVLVLSEIFGVHEHIADVCRRLAKEGYYAIAVEHFARAGDVRAAPDIGGVTQIVAKVSDAQVMADLDAALAFATKEGAQADRLAITGYCWGGRIVWLYAARAPKLKAGAAWYGRVTGPKDEARPLQPVDMAEKIKAPILGLYGGKDQGIAVADVQGLVDAVNKAGGKAELVVFPDAPHAFHADYRPSYREAEAKAGWAKMLAWFKTYV
jgi:carboxymethylenebutenolidase